MDTLPVQNIVAAPAAAGTASANAGAAGSASAATGTAAGDNSAPANDAATPPPFSALLAQQIGSTVTTGAKALPAAATDTKAADAKKSDTPDTTAAATDPLAGLVLPGWLPPGMTPAPAAPPSPAQSAHSGSNALTLDPGLVPSAGAKTPAVETSAPPPATGRSDTAVAANPARAGIDNAIDARATASTTAAKPAVAAQPETAAAVTAIAARAPERPTQLADANAMAMAAPATAPAAPAAAQAVQALQAPVGSADWNNELGQKIVWMIGDKQHVAELHVNPPELGPLDIKLTVDGGQTSAVFTSPHGAVRDAVESALPRLREVLADSGITLGNASVTADTPRDNQAFAGQRQTTRLPDGPPADSAALPAAPRPLRSTRGMVDLFA